MITESQEIYLNNVCNRFKCKKILSFGGFEFMDAFLKVNGVEIFDCEQNQEKFDEVNDAYGSKENVTVYQFEPTNFGPDLVTQLKDRTFDLASVNAPRGMDLDPHRINTCLFSFPRCNFILLHDGGRVGEIETISVLKDLGATEIEKNSDFKGATLLRIP